MVDLMASNEYVFLTHWRVPGTLEQARGEEGLRAEIARRR
jgi:hypothetical protein